MRNLVLVFLFFVTFAMAALARPYNFMLSDKNISSCLVNSIYQDRDGMIWVSTENGLNRYDGTKVTIYRHEEGNEHSLAHNYVRYMFEDAEGHFLVGNYMGLQIYRRESDDFTPLATFPDGSPLLTSPSYIIQTQSGEIYVSGNLVCRVFVENDVPYFENPSWKDFPTTMTGELKLAKDGSLWCQQRMNDGVYCVSPDGKHVNHYTEGMPFSQAMAVLCDNEGNIFVQTTANDLYKHDLDSGMWRKVNATRISSANLKCIYRIDETHILIGTDGNGLKLLDETTGEVRDYVIDLPSLSSHYLKVHQIMRDRDGDLWLALFLKGVARIPMRESSFEYIGSQSASTDLIGSSSVSALLSDSKGNVWVGTDGEGLYRLNPSATTSYHYTATTDGGTIPSIVQTVFEDSEGTIWVGSYDEGCGRIDPKTGRFTSCSELFRRDMVASRIYGFAEDHEHRVWVASLGYGLFCYDLKTKRVIPELSFVQGVNLWSVALLITSDNHLVIGSYDGVYEIDLNQPELRPRHVFDRSIVFSLYEDTSHRLWAASSAGLIQFSLSSDERTFYTSSDGLAGNIAYSLMGDADNTLWIGTNHGLSHFVPETHSFTNYTDADGLQGNEFSKNVCCTDQLGRLWFGGAYGVSYFNPAQVHDIALQHHARITGFYFNNQPVSASTLSGGKLVVDGPVYNTREFRLAHTDNSFSIELSTVEFAEPGLLRYHYSMNGSEWTTLPQGSHLVSFSDLKPGSYDFRFKVTDGLNESDIEEVSIVIRPYWWESQWARITFLLFLLVIFGTFLYQKRRQYLVRQAMLEQQHAHEMDEAKLQLFATLAQKIRTPMTLILSPLLKLIRTDDDPARQAVYQTIHRNSEELIKLADQMLEVPSEETESSEIVPATENEADELRTTARTKYRLLVIDNDENIRSYLSKELSSDFHIEERADGQEALQYVFKHKPDLVIADVATPVLDGYQLCQRIKQNISLNHIPVILLAPKNDLESNFASLESGADAFLGKPFYIEILRHTALNLVKTRSQLRNSFNGKQVQEDKLDNIEMRTANDKLMERIMRCINQNLSNTEFSIDDLCQEVGISRVHLYRKLKELTNQSPRDFIRNVRLKQAERLLLRDSYSINEIAEAVGFSRSNNFSSAFKEQYGYPPLQWKAMQLENGAAAPEEAEKNEDD